MVISKTPLRISFAGGGTDLKAYYAHENGAVTSSAIDKSVYVIVKERFDDKIYINYSKKEIVDHVDEIQHDLVREAMKLAGIERGVEITTLADIPSEGSGLGSSSSVTVGLLNAFYHYRGIQVSAERLAQEACHIEIDLLEKPIGKQDQYIAAFGGIKYFKFKWDEEVDVQAVRLDCDYYREFNSNLILYYTGKTRDANKILSKQSRETKNKMLVLQRIKKHANLIRAALESHQLDMVGETLHETWLQKKQVVQEISNSDIDVMYQKAFEAGALGGKICGAGAGGFLLLYVPQENQPKVRAAMNGDYREFPFMLERHGSKIIFNYRSYAWK